MLIQKPTIDASLASMIGAPVIIQHQDITEKNADELRCGAISDAYFNDIDGWYYCEGVIWDKKAQKLIDKGWSVSCSYDFLGYNDEGGVENNIKYDKEFTKLNFTHLAIVDNPRYERANIVFNSKNSDGENGRWVTIRGTHVFIPDGKSLDDVMEAKGWTKGHKDFSKAMGDLKDLADKHNGVGKKEEKTEAKSTSDEDEGNLKSYKEVREQAEKQLEYINHKLEQEAKGNKRPDKIAELSGQKHYLEGAIEYYKKNEAEESESSGAKEISVDDYTKKYGRGVDDPDNWDDSAETRKIAKKYGFEYDKGGTYSSDGYSARVVDTMKDGHYIVGMEDDDGNTYNVDVTSIEEGFKALKDKKDGKSNNKRKSSIKPMTYDEAMKNYHFAAKASLGNDFYGESHSDAPDVMKSAKKYGFEYDGRGGGAQTLYDKKTGMRALSGIGKAGDGNYVISYSIGTDNDYSDDNWKFIATKDLDASFEHIKGEFDKKAANKSKNSNKTNNEKEQDMAIIRELKKLIKRVENNKGEQEMDEKEKVDNENVDNENVDKRKLIDEVGGILKGKVDEEVWRTVIGKLEKLSYDKSEAGSADNKKVKNEDEDKEVDNEDEKDKKEVEEVKEDVKEDVENKCKNSKFSFNKINEIYNSVKQVKSENKYVSRQDKLDSAVEYFK